MNYLKRIFAALICLALFQHDLSAAAFSISSASAINIDEANHHSLFSEQALTAGLLFLLTSIPKKIHARINRAGRDKVGENQENPTSTSRAPRTYVLTADVLAQIETLMTRASKEYSPGETDDSGKILGAVASTEAGLLLVANPPETAGMIAEALLAEAHRQFPPRHVSQDIVFIPDETERFEKKPYGDSLFPGDWYERMDDKLREETKMVGHSRLVLFIAPDDIAKERYPELRGWDKDRNWDPLPNYIRPWFQSGPGIFPVILFTNRAAAEKYFQLSEVRRIGMPAPITFHVPSQQASTPLSKIVPMVILAMIGLGLYGVLAFGNVHHLIDGFLGWKALAVGKGVTSLASGKLAVLGGFGLIKPQQSLHRLQGRLPEDFNFPNGFSTVPGNNLLVWLQIAMKKVESLKEYPSGELIKVYGSFGDQTSWEKAGDIDVIVSFKKDATSHRTSKFIVQDLADALISSFGERATSHAMSDNDHRIVLQSREGRYHFIKLHVDFLGEVTPETPLTAEGFIDPLASYYASPEMRAPLLQLVVNQLDSIDLEKIRPARTGEELSAAQIQRLRPAKPYIAVFYNAILHMMSLLNGPQKNKIYMVVALLRSLLEKTGLTFDGYPSVSELRVKARYAEPSTHKKVEEFLNEAGVFSIQQGITFNPGFEANLHRMWTFCLNEMKEEIEKIPPFEQGTKPEKMISPLAGTLSLPEPLRPFAGEQVCVRVQGGTVIQALDNLKNDYPDLHKQLFTDDGKLRDFVKSIQVNGKEVLRAKLVQDFNFETDWLELPPLKAGPNSLLYRYIMKKRAESGDNWAKRLSEQQVKWLGMVGAAGEAVALVFAIAPHGLGAIAFAASAIVAVEMALLHSERGLARGDILIAAKKLVAFLPYLFLGTDLNSIFTHLIGPLVHLAYDRGQIFKNEKPVLPNRHSDPSHISRRLSMKLAGVAAALGFLPDNAHAQTSSYISGGTAGQQAKVDRVINKLLAGESKKNRELLLRHPFLIVPVIKSMRYNRPDVRSTQIVAAVVDGLTEDELAFVLAHEVGHYDNLNDFESDVFALKLMKHAGLRLEASISALNRVGRFIPSPKNRTELRVPSLSAEYGEKSQVFSVQDRIEALQLEIQKLSGRAAIISEHLAAVALLPLISTENFGPHNQIGAIQDPERNYPIHRLSNGETVILKYGTPSSVLDRRSVQARFVYEMARKVGFERINTVQLTVHNGRLKSVEQYFGESLSEVSEFTDADLTGSLDLSTPHWIRHYGHIADKLGPDFVQGDVFRLFSLYAVDSSNSDQIRIDPATGEIRWTDYGFGFVRNESHAKEAVHLGLRRYLDSHKSWMTRDAADLLHAIANLSDEDIQSVASSMTGDRLENPLIHTFAKDAVDRLTIRLMLHNLLKEFVDEATARRNVFREFLKGVPPSFATASSVERDSVEDASDHTVQQGVFNVISDAAEIILKQRIAGMGQTFRFRGELSHEAGLLLLFNIATQFANRLDPILGLQDLEAALQYFHKKHFATESESLAAFVEPFIHLVIEHYHLVDILVWASPSGLSMKVLNGLPQLIQMAGINLTVEETSRLRSELERSLSEAS